MFSLPLHDFSLLQLFLRYKLPNHSLMSPLEMINPLGITSKCPLYLINEPKGKNKSVYRASLSHKPLGWLIDLNSKWLLLFHEDPISLQGFTLFYIDKWDVSPLGTPNSFINRRKVNLEPAIETWNELLQNGWKKLEHQFGEAS